jgi:hypothetical protein
MKAMLRTVNDNGKTYDVLMFVCPGCAAGGPKDYEGLHMLPVNAENIDKPSWGWNGDLESPTLSPSILSKGYCVCHSFLRDGIFEFLTDSSHPLSGQNVPMPDLPDWATDMDLGDDDGD